MITSLVFISSALRNAAESEDREGRGGEMDQKDNQAKKDQEDPR